MHHRRVALSLLALATLSVGSAMAASPRDPPEYYVAPPPETSAEKRGRLAVEMNTVLRRLVGKFGLEHPWVFSQPPPPPNAARTMLDCIAIGDGVGMQCVSLTVLPPAGPSVRAGTGKQPQAPDRPLRARAPSRVSSYTEYGIDPNASRIRLMKVDRGTAVRMNGWVNDTTLTMEGRCWNRPGYCMMGLRMTPSADSDDIWVTEYMIVEGVWERTGRYALRRLTQEQADAADWNVEGARPTFPRKPGRPR